MLVLAALVQLKDVHTLTSCDNIPTVYWVLKLCCSSSDVAANLLKAWGSQMLHDEIPPPGIRYIKGEENELTDIPSRRFRTKLPDGSTHVYTDHKFLTYFNTKFPLPQNQSWQLLRLNSATVSRVIVMLLTEPCTMASW